MKWNKPKKLITNILVLFSVLSLLLTIIAFATSLVWIKSPSLVNKLDKKIPNFYVKDIDGLFKEMNLEKTTDGKFEVYKIINSKLNSLSSLDRYYPQKQDAYKFLIKYYTEKNKIEEALFLAKKWKKQNEYDFDAKFIYGKTLLLYSPEKARQYYENLYNRHHDIPEVIKEYILFLSQTKQFEKALEIQNEYNSQFSNDVNANYKIYYQDKNNAKYAETASFIFSDISKLSKHKVILKIKENFNLLSALRFDINNAPNGISVSDIVIDLKINDHTYKGLKFKAQHHLKKTSPGIYETIGYDPFFYIELPEKLKSYKGPVELFISLVIVNKLNIVQDKLVNSAKADK